MAGLRQRVADVAMVEALKEVRFKVDLILCTNFRKTKRETRGEVRISETDMDK